MRVLSLWILLWTVVVAAQESPEITVEVANRDAFLGDPVDVMVRVTYDPAAWTILDEGAPETLGEGSVLSAVWSEPAKVGEASSLERTELRLQIAWYKLGEHTLPPITIAADDADDERQTFETDERTINIMSMLTEEDQAPAPPKGQVAMDVAPLWPWLVAGVLLLAMIVAGVIYFLSKRERVTVEPPPPPPPPPYDEAIQALGELTHGSLLKEGQIKAFHVAVNQIIRHFYHRIFKINAEEMTSFEIESWFDGKRGLHGDLTTLNRDFQEACDRVKFAKHDPVEAEIKQVVNWAYQIVELYKPMEEVAPDVEIG